MIFMPWQWLTTRYPIGYLTKRKHIRRRLISVTRRASAEQYKRLING